MFIQRLFLTILCLALQVLLFNYIHIMGYAVPLICTFPLLLFPLESPRWEILVWGFCIGLVEDAFTNTPGIACTTFTLIAMLQPALLHIFTPRDEEDKDVHPVPSAQTLGWSAMIRYLMLTIFIQEAVYYALELFSLFRWQEYAYQVLSSWVLSVLILITFESFRRPSRHKRNS